MKCPQCEQENPASQKFCGECGTPLKHANHSRALSYADLQSAHAEALEQLTEALGQQTTTSEILKIISSSPTDAQPVFDAIAESAVRLCDGLFSGVFRFDGNLIHFVAHNNWTDEGLESVRRAYPRAPSREALVATAILDRTVVEVPTLRTTREFRRRPFRSPEI